MREAETTSPDHISHPENYFHFRVFYCHMHNFCEPTIGCRQVLLKNFDVLVERQRLFSPETGPELVRELFQRSGEISGEFVNRAIPDVLAFARETVSDRANEESSTFIAALEIDLLAASSYFEASQDLELFRAALTWVQDRTEHRDVRESMVDEEYWPRAIREAVQADGARNNGMVPARRDSVEALEKVRYEELGFLNLLEDQCRICLDDFSEGKEKTFRKMPCSHVFDEDCIFRWLRTSHSCPLCRHKLPVAKNVIGEIDRLVIS